MHIYICIYVYIYNTYTYITYIHNIYTYIGAHCMKIHTFQNSSHSPACYRVAKTHRIPYLYRSFPAKEPYI